MPITHQWNGTVLTITSDSGTSSADLKGQKGDDGARGAQGIAGSAIAEDTAKLGGIVADDYATKAYVNNAINNVDLSEYAKKNEVNQSLEQKTDVSILANGEQSMGSYSVLTIRRNIKKVSALRAVLFLPNAIYCIHINGNDIETTKIGGIDIIFDDSVKDEITMVIASWTRFKLLVMSGEYELIYSN